MKKRFLILALTLVLCLSLLPAGALAAELPDYTECYIVLENEDAHGSIMYRSLPHTSGQISDYFRYKENVSFEIAPNDGWLVKSAAVRETVSGNEVASTLSGNTVSFVITADSTLTVSYKPAAAPEIATQPRDITVKEGGTATFSVKAVGEELSYQWYAADPGDRSAKPLALKDSLKISKLEPAISGAKSAKLTLNNVAAASNGATFYCVVTNAAGSAKSSAATLKVGAAANAEPVITQQPQDITVKEGEPLVFTVAATGENLHYRWSIDNGIDTETFFDDIMDVASFRYADECSFDDHNGLQVYCYIYNLNGGVTSDIATVTVTKSAASAGAFTDISPSDWFYNDVLTAVSLGLVNGTTASTYEPDANLTVSAAIKLAACMHQKYNTGAVTLKNGSVNWYDTYVSYAEANGIIKSGEWAGKYEQNATRAEFVRIFYPALPNTSYTDINSVADDAIPDVKLSESWAGPVYAFYRAGILTGSDLNGTFNPGSNISRSEVAAILSRMMDPGARKFVVLPRPDVSALQFPSCWTASNDRFFFFTLRGGLPAVEYGTWDDPVWRGHGPAYVTRATRSGEHLTLEIYYPRVREAADSYDLMEDWQAFTVDLSNLDKDGRINIQLDGKTEWIQCAYGGTTWQAGYDSVHP